LVQSLPNKDFLHFLYSWDIQCRKLRSQSSINSITISQKFPAVQKHKWGWLYLNA
jgi:hypothetical protein